jgi:hypothetical protein
VTKRKKTRRDIGPNTVQVLRTWAHAVVWITVIVCLYRSCP